MSILVVQLVPQGLIFGADQNVTHKATMKVCGKQKKILAWPDGQTILGWVGRANIDGKNMDEWLRIFIEANDNGNLDAVSCNLKEKLERLTENEIAPPEPLVIHIGRFEEKDDTLIPRVYYIVNSPDANSRQFLCREELWLDHYFGEFRADKIKQRLERLANNFTPFWFHQGFDLGTFNTFDAAIKSSFRVLCKNHRDHQIPKTLEDWENHVKMSINTYSAFFNSFFSSDKRWVGGEAEVLSIPWPE